MSMDQNECFVLTKWKHFTSSLVEHCEEMLFGDFVIGVSLSEPHCYVANRGEAQCIMVRTYTELFCSD